MSGETQAKGGGRGGLARRKEKTADAGGKDRVGKIQTREIERGVEARNVWRRRGGRCVGDKRLETAIFCSSEKEMGQEGKNTNREEEDKDWLVEKGESWVWWAGLDWGGGGDW